MTGNREGRRRRHRRHKRRARAARMARTTRAALRELAAMIPQPRTGYGNGFGLVFRASLAELVRRPRP